MSFSSQVEKTSQVINDLYTHRTTMFIAVLMIGLALQTQGFCADTNTDMDAIATDVIDKVFQPWIRKIMAGLSGAWGVFKCYGAGNFSPIILWGGLSLVLVYIPKIIAWF